MAGIEVKAVDNLLGTPFPYAYAVKAGPWLFLTGHEAVDFTSGTPAEVAGAPGFPLYGLPRSRREGDFILQRMRRILREFGSDLSNAVRLDQYYPNPQAVAAYHHSRHAEFRDYIPPSTSVVMERCFAADATISTSLTAVVPGPGRDIRKVHPPGVASAPTSGFVPAVVCDEFVFVAGQMAHNPGQGLDPRAHRPEHSAWAGTEIRLQTEYLIEHKLKPALEAAGSSLDGSLKAQIYLASMADLPEFLDVWQRHYAAIPCAVTVVPTKSFATIGGIIEINLIALTNGARRDKQVIAADIPGMAAQGPCVRAGEFLFPSGLMAVGDDGHVVGNALFANFAGLSHAGYTQASAVYDYAEALCRAAGTTMANTLRAQYFVPDVSDFAGIATAWKARFGARPHPFVCVQTPADMPAPGIALIADFWISTVP
jgi:enamine deaminase RidA (YjgF/YER057c/UK114 family)